MFGDTCTATRPYTTLQCHPNRSPTVVVLDNNIKLTRLQTFCSQLTASYLITVNQIIVCTRSVVKRRQNSNQFSLYFMNISIHGTQVTPAAQHAPETDSNILSKLPNSAGNRQMPAFNQYGVMYCVMFVNYGYQMLDDYNCKLCTLLRFSGTYSGWHSINRKPIWYDDRIISRSLRMDKVVMETGNRNDLS